MIDREKIIRGLECCTADGCDGCPYEVDDDLKGECIKRTQEDALKLINDLIRQADACHLPQSGRLNGETEQVAEPVYDGKGWSCGACGEIYRDVLDAALYRHCPGCGRRLIWIHEEKDG